MKKFSRVNAEIDYDALEHNLHVMASKLKEGTKICAVVKADAYGHGALPIARRLESEEIVWGYACATAEEAMGLRAGGIRKPIMLLGYAFEESYEDLVDYDIRACIFEEESAEKLARTARSLMKTAKVHIALDTGMSRIGFEPDEKSVESVVRISKMEGVEIEGLFTHFARADEKDLSHMEEQFTIYRRFVRALRNRGLYIPISHVSNSAALMRCPDANLDMVRAGITMYGLMPSDEVADEMTDLVPLMRLVSHISCVKTLPEGRAVSYGGTYVTTRETTVATIPVGYADGYPRSLSNRGYVLLRGKKVPVIGRICMDQFMVDVTGIPDVHCGEEVVLLGEMNGERITAEELGSLSGRFNYELVCDISKRVPRTYRKNGQVLEQTGC